LLRHGATLRISLHPIKKKMHFSDKLLGNLREVIGELVFFDDEKVFSVGLNQSQGYEIFAGRR